MLRAMRRNMKIIMLAVAVSFIGLMVFQWGMDITGRSNPQRVGEVGRVNGRVISYQEWTQTFRTLSDQARQQKGSALNDQELELLEDQTWSLLVSRILVDQELRRLGIKVTDDEIRLAFQTTPPPWLASNELFQTNGEFDYEKYRAFFSQAAADPQLLAAIEEYYRDELPRAKLREQIVTGIYVSDSELWAQYRDRTEQVQLRYVVFDPEVWIADSAVSVSEDDVRRSYEAHREDFKQPELAEVMMAAVSRLPTAADSAAALERARRLRSELLGGADFAELARQNSADRGSASSGGDLGWFTRGDMAPRFEAAAFALAPGQLSEPVLTGFGYHLIELHEREGDRVHASHILIQISLGSLSEDEFFASVDRLERVALRSGLAAGLDSLGLQGRRVTLAKGSDFVPGLGQFGAVQQWAFHDSTAVGDLSPVYETEQGFYMFELVSRTPETYTSLPEVEPSIRRRVMLEKKQEAAARRAADVAGELRAGKSLTALAAEHGLQPQQSPLFTRLTFVPGIGRANAVIGTAFGLHEGEIAGPVEADGRLYFLEILAHAPADRTEFEAGKETMRAQVIMQRQQIAVDEWLSDLRERADIMDWRQQFFSPRS
jgi:peptidyl-prolyl cis-trans isomerase D